MSRRPAAPPATKLSDDEVAKAIRSFHWGAGAGPSGCRLDFLRRVIGTKSDRPGLRLVAKLCNLLADGQAPPALRLFFGGSKDLPFAKKPRAALLETTLAQSAQQRFGDE